MANLRVGLPGAVSGVVALDQFPRLLVAQQAVLGAGTLRGVEGLLRQLVRMRF